MLRIQAIPAVFLLLVFSVLYEKDQPRGNPGQWRNLPPENSPLEIGPDGKPFLSPWGQIEPWHEAGVYQTRSGAFAQIQQWYPDPPRVILLSNNEARILKPKQDVENFSRRYLDAYGRGKSEWFQRRVMVEVFYLVREEDRSVQRRP